MAEKKIYKFLFKIIDDQIWIYQPRADHISCVKREGREARQFGKNFWEQWQNEFDFIPSRHDIDFAFISPTSRSIESFNMPVDFQHSCNGTFWTLSKIEKFMQKFFEFDRVQLKEHGKNIWGCGREEWYLVRHDSSDNKKSEDDAGISIKQKLAQKDLPKEMIEFIKDS